MYDILSLVSAEERDDGREWVAVEPDAIYPATIARIREVLQSGEFPEELADNSPTCLIRDGVAHNLLAAAREIRPWDWSAALRPFEPGADRYWRAQALEVARLWFTQAIHVAMGGDGTFIGIHILKDERYRL